MVLVNLDDEVESGSQAEILIVDNQDVWLELAARELSAVASVDTARGGSFAEEKLRKDSKVKLVLTDLHMHQDYHGDQLVYRIVTQHPNIRVGLLSGTISEDARQKVMAAEPGLAMIGKSELVNHPDTVRERVKFLLERPPQYLNSLEALRIMSEETRLKDISGLFEQIDALAGEAAIIRRDLYASSLDDEIKARMDSLLKHDSLYSDDVEMTRSKIHDYKNLVQVAASELSQVRNIEANQQLLVDTSALLFGLRDLLQQRSERESLADIWLEETTNVSKMFPNAVFVVDKGSYASNEKDLEKIYVNPGMGEVLRNLLMNAVQAYDTKEDKVVSLRVDQGQGLHRDDLSIKVTNGGRQMPEEYRDRDISGVWDSEGIPSESVFGTKFGLRRIASLEGRLMHSLKYDVNNEGQTEAIIELYGRNSKNFEIRLPTEPSNPGGKLLVFDHGDDFQFLKAAEDRLECEIDYVTSLQDLRARIPNAGNYFGFLHHAYKGQRSVVDQMIGANPLMVEDRISSQHNLSVSRAKNMIDDMKTKYQVPVDERDAWRNRLHEQKYGPVPKHTVENLLE